MLDGVHPNDQGHELIANQLEKEILRILVASCANKGKDHSDISEPKSTLKLTPSSISSVGLKHITETKFRTKIIRGILTLIIAKKSLCNLLNYKGF